MSRKLNELEKKELNRLTSKKYLSKKDINNSILGSKLLPNITNARQMLWHISIGNNSIPLCPVCSSKLKWNSDKRKYRDFCSKKCTGIGTKEKAKQTSKNNHNGVHHTQTKEFRNKIKETSLKKFNTEHYSKTEEYKQRVIETNLKTLGVTHPAQSPIIRAKMQQTSLERYGVDNYAKTEECQTKMSGTNFKRYGVQYPLQNEEISRKVKKTNIEKYGVQYPAQNTEINKQITETRKKNYYSEHVLEKLNNADWLFNEQKKKTINQIANELGVSSSNLGKYFMKYNIPITNVNFNTSDAEKEIVSFIKSLGISNISQNNRNTIFPKELDILLPDYNLAIEFNGTYWHTQNMGKDKHYHLSKTTKCEEQGIQLLHIADYEWNDITKQDIWKSIIKTKIGFSNRIFARKCILKNVLTNEAKDFMNNNHLEGFVGGNIKLGLYFDNELVQCIIVGKSRFNKHYQYELTRSATIKNTVIVGGLSKLLSRINGSLISYANRRYSNGNSYVKIGMRQKKSSSPNYKYTSYNGIVSGSRNAFQKHKLKDKLDIFDLNLSEWENMQANGYDRIWDCGNLVYTINLI